MTEPSQIETPLKDTSSPPGAVGNAFQRLLRALFAGISLAELRAMVNGQEVTERPNPRLRAHILSFLLHIRPRTYVQASTRFTYTFFLGFFTVFCFVVEVITGIILMVYYVPTPAGAYASILRLVGEVSFGEVIRDVHRLAAETMVILAFLHLLRTFLTVSYRGHHRFTWVSGVALLVLTVALTYTGYLLPWDQLAYWAISVGTGLASGVPLIGDRLTLLIRGSAEVGGDGLLRFYLLHIVILPLLASAILSAHYYRVARHGLTLPPEVEEGALTVEQRAQATRRVPYLPEIFSREILLILLGTLGLFIAAIFFYDAPLQSHANPQQTPFQIEAPWFFLWVQGLLKYGDKTLMGIVVPGLVLIGLAAWPYLDRNPSRLLRRRPLVAAVTVILLAGLGWLTYAGTPAYGIQVPPAVRIAQKLAPEEGRGPLRSIPYEQMAPGVYQLAGTGAAPAREADLPAEQAALRAFLTEYAAEIRQVADELPEAQAFLIINEPQKDLKKLVLRMVWNAADGQSYQVYERVVFFHRLREGK